MNWKLIFVAVILAASFAFATGNGTVDLKVTKVTSNPRHLYAGTQDVSLMVTLVNAGTKTLSRVETTLDLSSEFEESFSNSDYYYVGTLMPNVPAILQFDINVDAEAESNEECFEVEIDSEEGNFVEDLCLTIDPKPEVEIKDTNIPRMFAGQTFPVSVEVKNIGEEKASDVKVKLLIPSAMPFTVKENLQELGRLDENEKSTALFDVFVEEDARTKEFKIEVQIRYVSDSGNDENVYVTVENIEFDVMKNTDSFTGAFTILANPLFALIFGAVVIAAFLFIRNKNKTSKRKK